jgi:hypothetical protein
VPEFAHVKDAVVGALVPAGDCHVNVNDVLATEPSVTNQMSIEPVDDVNVDEANAVPVLLLSSVADVDEPAYTLT